MYLWGYTKPIFGFEGGCLPSYRGRSLTLKGTAKMESVLNNKKCKIVFLVSGIMQYS